MRILLTWRGCAIGGLETWMLALARAFVRLGHHCELFFFERGPFVDTIPPDITAHCGTLADLLRLVDRRRFDVVQSATIDWDTGVSAVRRLGAKLVVQGNGWVDPGWNSSNCDAIVGCSVWNARAQQALSDLPVQVVPNGIALERFPAFTGVTQGPPIVAWVGRGGDLKQKQIDKLAAVAPFLRQGGVRLWLADPDGPQKVPQEYARVLGVAAEKWESIPPGSMTAFYHQVAASGGCILSTSRFEGLSLAYLEAQACGCPVIGPDVVGVNESLDVRSGGVLYPATAPPQELAQVVLRTLGDEKEMEWRRHASREFVSSRFSIEGTAQAYLQVYEGAPFTSVGIVSELRSRVRISPLNWRQYVKHCWGAGNRQFLASRQLLDAGAPRLARVAMRASLATAPTLFIRPRRLSHCIRILSGRSSAAHPGVTSARPG